MSTEIVSISKDEWEFVKTLASLGAILGAFSAERIFNDEAPMGDMDIIRPHLDRLRERAGSEEVQLWLASTLASLVSSLPARSYDAAPPGWLATE